MQALAQARRRRRARGLAGGVLLALALGAAFACHRRGSPEECIRQFSSMNPDVRTRAGNELITYDPDEAVPLLIAAAGHELVRVRFEVMRMLGRFGDPRGIPTLIAALGDESPRPAAMAAASLAQLRAVEALPALLRYVRDPSPEVRRYVIAALGPCHSYAVHPEASDSAHAHVLRALDDPTPDIRVAALQSVREFGYRGAAPLLLRLAEDPASQVRYVAVQALGELGAAGVKKTRGSATRDPVVGVDAATRAAIVEALRERLEPDELQSVRTASVRSLGEMRAAAAAARLRELAATGTEDDRREARRALALIAEQQGDAAR